MFCSNCGTELVKGAHFCAGCGASVDGKSASKKTGAEPGLATAPEPEKKMALWKKILLGFVGFVVIVVALALMLTSDLVDPIDRQLAAIKAGNLEAAYAETSIAFKRATSQEKFAAFIRANPVLNDVADHTFTDRSRENDVGSVKGTLKTKDGGVIPVEYRLVRENGEWRILGIQLGKRQ